MICFHCGRDIGASAIAYPAGSANYFHENCFVQWMLLRHDCNWQAVMDITIPNLFAEVKAIRDKLDALAGTGA